MKLKQFLSVGVLFSVIFTMGCSMVPVDHYAGIHETKPVSILIPPVVNKSVDVMAGTSVLTTLPRGLGEKGYYVFPVNTVKSLLEFEGFMDAAEIHSIPPIELAGLFGADVIMYVTIHSWTSRYLVLVTQTEVDIEYQIVSRNGDALWADREKMIYTPQNDSSGHPLADFIGMVVQSAVERAAPNYLKLVRQANNNVFYHPSHPFPPGPYAPNYKDYYAGHDSPVLTQ